RLVDGAHQRDSLLDERALEAERECQPARLERLQADGRIDEGLEDAIGCLFGHLLDLDAAIGADHEHRALRRAIDHETEIELAGDIEPLLDEQATDDAALGTGLVSHERHAEHGRCGFEGGLRILDHLDASTLASSSRVNLRLDDDGAAAEAFGSRLRFSGCEDDFALWNRDAVLCEDGLALVLVDLHRAE